MKTLSRSYRKISIYTSQSCFVLFIVFYVLAASKFPGGTYTNPRQKGFSFTENYLCDLLDDFTYLLEDNPAKIYARIALGFLCLGIFLFWFHLPYLFQRKSNRIKLMWVSGMMAMLVTAFLRPGNHDLVTFLAGGFGTVAMILAFVELNKSGLTAYMILGIICLLMILLNYYIYETRMLISILPLFQKFTIIAGIGWFILLQLKLRQQL